MIVIAANICQLFKLKSKHSNHDVMESFKICESSSVASPGISAFGLSGCPRLSAQEADLKTQ